MKQKQKRKSIVLFILGLLLVAALVLVNIFGATIGGSDRGAAKNIILGLDLKNVYSSKKTVSSLKRTVRLSKPRSGRL